jgi:flavin reductase (DIM6/NTAB) family NADH-FMN oxidoreductase RutF
MTGLPATAGEVARTGGDRCRSADNQHDHVTARAQDQAELRRVFGAFPTGVTAIAALTGGAPAGIAAGSFTPVSLDPPIVSICVAHTSTTWPILRAAARLGISVLGAHQEQHGRALSARAGDRFAAVQWRATSEGAVVLEGASAWLDCSVERQIAGDGDLDDLVTGQRDGRVAENVLGVAVVPVGGGLGLRGLAMSAGDLAGEGLQDAGAGDPALDLVPVRGQQGQAVAAVDLQMAQRLAEGLRGEQGLRVVPVTGPVTASGPAAPPLPAGGGAVRRDRELGPPDGAHDVGDLQVLQCAPGGGVHHAPR